MCVICVSKKGVRLPTEEEIKVNSPSRSAKLRVVRKLSEPTDLHLNGVIGY